MNPAFEHAGATHIAIDHHSYPGYTFNLKISLRLWAAPNAAGWFLVLLLTVQMPALLVALQWVPPASIPIQSQSCIPDCFARSMHMANDDLHANRNLKVGPCSQVGERMSSKQMVPVSVPKSAMPAVGRCRVKKPAWDQPSIQLPTTSPCSCWSMVTCCLLQSSCAMPATTSTS